MANNFDTETLVELIELIGIEQALSVCDGMFLFVYMMARMKQFH